jgi:endonuclease/exonuclease/phosphatase (EEP) superfamily protein YafD
MMLVLLFLIGWIRILAAGDSRVLSLNLANAKDTERIARELRERTDVLPDILLLQEVAKLRASHTSVAEDLARLIGFHVVFATPKPSHTSVGLAILSRWPITDKVVRKVRRFYRVIRVRPRLALAATIAAPDGPIRVWTTHLDTRINIGERLDQLRPLLAELKEFSGPCIFGGDLNTIGLRWLAHTVPFPSGKAHARAVTKLMGQHGFRTPFEEGRPTFDLLGMQLDWIYLRGLRAGATGIEPLRFSDHHAIWTEFSIPKAVRDTADGSR